LASDPEPPTVVLDELLVDDRARKSAGLHASGNPGEPGATVMIEAGARRIEFRYTALSWPAPDFVRFRHRLEGFDPNWVDAGRNRAVHYNGLSPRQYRFELMAANRDGVWGVPVTLAVFSIEPFFWQTWWFQTAGALGLAAAVGVLVTWVLRRRHQLRLERLKQMHAVEQERARIAQDIHDDLGASLTQIALLSELAQAQMSEPQTARSYLDMIFNNARSLARATDEIVWALHPKNSAVELSLNFITRFAQEYLRVAGVRCRLDIPPELPDASMPSVTRHHLYLAVKEALNNVVKHAHATEVWLRLQCDQDRVVLSIEDNGCGFDRSARLPAGTAPQGPRRGHGLQGMEQRMRAIGGGFEQTSEIGRGTVTRLSVPLGH
jgi:signal transduction histidine kinase